MVLKNKLNDINRKCIIERKNSQNEKDKKENQKDKLNLLQQLILY